MKKWALDHQAALMIGTIGACLIGLAVAGMLLFGRPKHKAVSAEDSNSITTSDNQTGSSTKSKKASPSQIIRFIATGDFIAHESVYTNAKKGSGYDFLQFMKDFQPVFQKADIRFCNQATLAGGEAFGISGYPVFNAPKSFAKDMASLGCNLVNLASNHSSDKTTAAVDASVANWDNVAGLLAVAGENRNTQEQQKLRTFTVKGLKFGFLAYTTYSNKKPANSYAVNVFSRTQAAKDIKAARQAGAQFIIVSMRWGTEYSAKVNAEQKSDSQFLADAGANVILGHGPHVLQTVDIIKSKVSKQQTIVWYSLGNFINTQLEPETLFNGIAVMEIDPVAHDIRFIGWEPFYMHYEWSAADKSSGNLLARHNLHLYPLENATDALVKKSQLGTTIAAQKKRMQQLLNASITVNFVTKADLTK